MKKPLLCLAIAFSTGITTLTHANTLENENNTLYVHITNATHDQLRFDHVAGSKPGNEYTVSPQTINPGESAIVTAEKRENNDIQGNLIFVNAAGEEATLYILDQQQFHIGQPVFSFSSNQYHSTLLSRTRNKNVGPRYLSYVAAELRVENR